MLMLVALSAIILPLILLVVFRLSAKIGMPIAAVVVGLLAFFIWRMEPTAIAASLIQGTHRAITIGWILFGALFFLYTMRASGFLQTIKAGFSKASPDMRIQTVLIAFLFVSLIEGVAGFGTPAAIAVPLLVALGFRPLTAVVLALTGDSVAVSFGAIGTPVFIGLENIPGADSVFFQHIAQTLTLLDFAAAVLLPTILVTLLLSLSKKHRQLQNLTEILPWTLFIGLTYALTTLVTAQIVGPAFISIIASIVTLAIAMTSINKQFLLPKNIWEETYAELDSTAAKPVSQASSVYAWLPYVAIVALLVMQRVVPSVKSWLATHVDLSLRSILGIDSINSLWPILTSPGTALVVVGLGILVVTRLSWNQYLQAARTAFKSTVVALMALVPTLIMIQTFSNSGVNTADLIAMPAYIAAFLATHTGFLWAALAPILGALTSFITGSSTISTLTMSPIQYSAAVDLGLPVEHVLAQQISGANAGNMIAIHNVVAALTAAKLPNQEWRVIRVTIIPASVYIAISVVSGLFISLFW